MRVRTIHPSKSIARDSAVQVSLAARGKKVPGGLAAKQTSESSFSWQAIARGAAAKREEGGEKREERREKKKREIILRGARAALLSLLLSSLLFLWLRP
jgi:hypothetical protein